MSYSTTTLLGRLGSDVKLSHTPSGAAVAEFSMATSKTWLDKQGQKQEKVSWHNLKVWNKQAEHCATYLAKGSQCLVVGELDYISWDKPDGTKGYKTEIVANKVQFIGSKSDSQSQGATQSPVADSPVATGPSYFDDSNDSVPF